MKYTLKDLNQMIAEVDRELAMRREVYPRRVKAGRMAQATADAYEERLQRVRDLLAEVRQRIGAGEPHQSLLDF